MADERDARIAQLEAELGLSRAENRVLHEQQTALGEVLRVIASSPTELARVFETVAERAAHLYGARAVAIWRMDGAVLRLVADTMLDSLQLGATLPLSAQTMTGRAILNASVLHIHDVRTDENRREFPASAHTMSDYPTRLHVPLVRNGTALGAIVLAREVVQPFTDHEVAAIQTFADQAVIAIENARLFDELEERNADLQESNRQVTEALEQQTATAEILRVIASSPSDLQLVLDGVVERAAGLCRADTGLIQQRDGDLMKPVAIYGARVLQLIAERRTNPRGGVPVRMTSIAGRAMLDRRTIHVPDALAVMDTEFPDSRYGQQALGS